MKKLLELKKPVPGCRNTRKEAWIDTTTPRCIGSQ
ncbi:hypothetical protein HNR33_003459 [Brassicibacter mesophilus]